jgi:hypothetical protein
VLAELRAVFPDWRFGQRVANVATAARGAQVEALWDRAEEELLAAARRLLERNRGRAQVSGGLLSRVEHLCCPLFRSSLCASRRCVTIITPSWFGEGGVCYGRCSPDTPHSGDGGL